MEHKIDLSAESGETRMLAEQIAKERIVPNASGRDLTHTFPWDVVACLRREKNPSPQKRRPKNPRSRRSN